MRDLEKAQKLVSRLNINEYESKSDYVKSYYGQTIDNEEQGKEIFQKSMEKGVIQEFNHFYEVFIIGNEVYMHID